MNERENFIRLQLSSLLKSICTRVETVMYKKLKNGKEQLFIMDKDNIILVGFDITKMSHYMIARKVICALPTREGKNV